MNAENSSIEIAISNCNREKINVIGEIQNFGLLLVVDAELSKIIQISYNCLEFFKVKNIDLFPTELRQIFSRKVIHQFRNAAGLIEENGRHQLGKIDCAGVVAYANLCQANDSYLIELEPQHTDDAAQFDVIEQIQTMLRHLQDISDSTVLLKKMVSLVRYLVGFDRVMAYRFLSDGTGEVVAESVGPGVDSFLGLRYPATDIPQAVRDLALIMPVRFIADISASPVPIIDLNQSSTVDLSLSYLRGVSPIHIEYLTNMQVGASMNLAITVQGKLWGLIACHHRQAKNLPIPLRAAFELFGSVFSLHLQQVLAQERFAHRQKISSTVQYLADLPRDTFSFLQSATWLYEMLGEIIQIDGLAVVAEQKIEQAGTTPDRSFIMDLICHCQEQTHNTQIFPIENFHQLPYLKNELELADIGGALVVEVSQIEQLYLIFFRREIAKQIRWGGNPDKEIITGQFGPRLKPRASFEEYLETIHGRCEPWSTEDMNTVMELRKSLLYLAVSQVEVIHEDILRQKQQQDLLIAELNHRVKNILTLIRSIARQTQESSDNLVDFAKSLEDRIVALASAHDLVSGNQLEWPELRDLILIELRPYLSEADFRVQLSGKSVRLKASCVSTLVLVLHELTSNAAKYGALSSSEGKVCIRWQQKNGGLKIHWQEKDGPVVIPPSRTGFGRRLIERAIAFEFDGKTQLDFNSTGLEANFWIPSEFLLWPSSPQENDFEVAEKADEAKKRKPISKILIVEDNLLIAMDYEDILRGLGVEDIDTAARSHTALELINSHAYDFAMLDVDLRGESSFEVGKALAEQTIPFIFITGYDSKFTIPPELEKIPRLVKPLSSDDLIQILQPYLL